MSGPSTPAMDLRLPQALASLVRLAVRACAASGAAVLLIEGERARVVASHGTVPAVPDELRRRAAAGSPAAAAPRGGTACAVAVIRTDGAIVGVMEVDGIPAPAAEEATAALGDLAEQAAVVIGQHRRIWRLLELAWQRAQAANQLIEHEEQFRLALDALGAHIAILDGDGRIIAVNQAWRDYGAERGGAAETGSSYLDVCDRAAAAGVADASSAAAGIRAVATGLQRRFELEYACPGPGSEERWFILRVTRFPRSDRQWVVAAHTDVTERRRSERALRESRERFAGIISSALDAIITIDAADRVTVFNAAAERMFGWRADEVIGGPLARLLPAGLHRRQLALLGAIRSAAPPNGPLAGGRLLHARRRLGEEFPIEASLSRLETAAGTLITVIVRDVTERERSQRALRRSEHRWTVAVQGSNDGIWEWSVDEGAWFSQRCHEMLGYAAEEFPQDLEHWLGLLHPDDREMVCEALVRHVLGAAPLVSVEYRARCRDGSWKWLLTRGRAEASPDGVAGRMAGSTTDISERKLAEFALRESQARNAAIIDSALDAILAMDAAGRITRFNPAAERIFGWKEGEVLGRDLADIVVPPEHREAHRRAIANYLATGTSRILGRRLELESVRSDGSRMPVEMAVVAVPVEGSLLFIGHLRDLSERRAAEARMRRHEQQLIQSEKMVALGTLVSGVAHEINNPANFIALNTPLLLRLWHGVLPVLDAHAETDPSFAIGAMPWNEARALVPQCHDGIQEGVRRIKRIVTDLKDFAREDTPGFADDVDLNAVIATAVRLAEHTVRKWTHTLRLDLAAGLPVVSGSHQRLEQVVINLLINACQALPRHECAIHVRTMQETGTGMVALEVEDQGIGMSPETLQRATEPFFTTKRDLGGTGLGLSVSAAIIAEHGGTLTFASVPGVGTTVRVRLPVDRQPG